MLIVTILPILLPLATALANAFLPIRFCQTSWYRFVRLALLIAVAGLLVKVPALTTGAFALSLSVAGLITLPPLTFLYTNTSLAVGLVYICSQFLTTLHEPLLGHPYPRRTLELVTVSCVLATCLAANITTLCYGWMAISAILVARRISLVVEEPAQLVYWDLISNIGSVILVMIVAVLAMIQQRVNTFGDIAASPFMVTLLLLAALLRLGLFPLPGNHQMSWVDRMAALCTGAWLLLRVASVSTQSFPGWNWLVPAIAASSVITALLANLMGTRQLCRNYMIASLVSAMVLAPLLVPVAGTGLAVLFLINLVLVAALLEQPGEGMKRMQAVVFKWLKVAAIPTLMGVPFTLGFLCRWELQRLTGGIDQKITIILLTMSYTLVTVYLWRQLALELHQVAPQPRPAGSRIGQQTLVNWVICGLGALFVLIELLVGFIPSSINTLMPTPLSLPSLTQSLAADITTWIYLIATTLVIPLAGAFFLYFQRSLFHLASPVFESVRWFVSFNWLYFIFDKLLGWVSRVGALILNGIERKYLLGWVLIWMIIIVAFLVGT